MKKEAKSLIVLGTFLLSIVPVVAVLGQVPPPLPVPVELPSRRAAN
jgi:hypothetical protein